MISLHFAEGCRFDCWARIIPALGSSGLTGLVDEMYKTSCQRDSKAWLKLRLRETLKKTG